MPDQPETCRVCKVTIPLLAISANFILLFPPEFMNLSY